MAIELQDRLLCLFLIANRRCHCTDVNAGAFRVDLGNYPLDCLNLTTFVFFLLLTIFLTIFFLIFIFICFLAFTASLFLLFCNFRYRIVFGSFFFLHRLIIIYLSYIVS